MEAITNLKASTASVRRCFGPTENPFFTEVLNTPEAKKQAYELIVQQAFAVDPFNITSNPASMAAFKDFVARHLDLNTTIGCYTSYPQGKLVGVDFLVCRQIGAFFGLPCEFVGEPYYHFIQYLRNIHDHVRAAYQGIDPNNWYLISLGMVVEPAYRHQDIQNEMIFLRKRVASALGIQVIVPEYIG